MIVAALGAVVTLVAFVVIMVVSHNKPVHKKHGNESLAAEVEERRRERARSGAQAADRALAREVMVERANRNAAASQRKFKRENPQAGEYF